VRDNSGGTVTKRYFAQGVQDNGSGYFEARDHLGSSRELIDSGGTVRARYDYDAWGRRTKVGGDKDADFGYAGQYQHSSSGLGLTRFRGFDANAGRWVSEDPIGLAVGQNFYEYVDNRPAVEIDPLGLWGWDGDYVQNAIGYGTDGTAAGFWEGFAEGSSKGSQGLISDFTGGWFDQYFDRQWRQLGRQSIVCDTGFKFGVNAGRVVEASLLLSSGLEVAGIESRIALHNASHIRTARKTETPATQCVASRDQG